MRQGHTVRSAGNGYRKIFLIQNVRVAFKKMLERLIQHHSLLEPHLSSCICFSAKSRTGFGPPGNLIGNWDKATQACSDLPIPFKDIPSFNNMSGDLALSGKA